MHSMTQRAFTLVEILIVVIILGILAAVVVPQVSSATQESAVNTTLAELRKIRSHIEYARLANSGALPNVTVGDGTWGNIIGPDGLRSAPINAWVGSTNGREIVFGAVPDNAFQSTHGWVYNPANGEVFAGSFDANDEPILP